MDSLDSALKSVWQYIKLVAGGKLHLSKDRLGRSYHISKIGEYKVFRETINLAPERGKHVVIVIGFRLKLLGSNTLMHKLFQKVCILTTPFWSGFAGFHIKLWMVQPSTGNYLGIYDWADIQQAQIYVNWLIKILRPLSTPDSVWYKIHEVEFEKYLEEYEYRLP